MVQCVDKRLKNVHLLQETYGVEADFTITLLYRRDEHRGGFFAQFTLIPIGDNFLQRFRSRSTHIPDTIRQPRNKQLNCPGFFPFPKYLGRGQTDAAVIIA